MSINSLTEVQWADIRDQFNTLNPTLTKIIDDIDPGPDYSFFKAVYSYGSEIIREGKLHIPNQNCELVPLFSHSVDKTIQEKLGYDVGTNPVSFILENTVEIFMNLSEHTIPLYGLVPKGKIFSTWHILSKAQSYSPAFLWNMTAGARSTFMLPKVNEANGYMRLKKEFHLSSDKPKNMLKHWQIFKELTNHKNFSKKPWKTTIIFFTKKWFEKLDDEKFKPLEHYMLRMGWNGSEYWRNQFVWNIAFSLIQVKRELQPNIIDADTIKHLIAMATGAVPGFAPAIDNQAGPIKRIQEIYSDIYKVKYEPVIMQPLSFSLYSPKRSVYYSLQYPSSLEFSSRPKERKSAITELYMIQSLLRKYLEELITNSLNIHNTPLHDLTKLTKFDFFHTQPGDFSNIKDSAIIPIEDPSFKSLLKDSNYPFPLNSTFIKGCIRISPQKK